MKTGSRTRPPRKTMEMQRLVGTSFRKLLRPGEVILINPANIQALANALRIGIDLTSLIPTLDNAASELISHQRDALTQRKDLAQKTKDFRKLDDAGKLAEIKGLLKGARTSHSNIRLG